MGVTIKGNSHSAYGTSTDTVQTHGDMLSSHFFRSGEKNKEKMDNVFITASPWEKFIIAFVGVQLIVPLSSTNWW